MRWEDYRLFNNINNDELRDVFRAWECHFWMIWTEFEKTFKYSNKNIIKRYLPCDCADRQCNMACAYFGGKCPRENEELKIPESLGFNGRWEYKD